MLEADLRGRGIAWNDQGTVNRGTYAARLGVTRGAIAYHHDILAPFDRLGPKAEPIKHSLRDLLAADAAAGKIVTSRVIHREHYAEMLGGLQNTQYYKSIFEEFEAKLGLGNSTEHRLQQLLKVDFAAGWLPISREGGIDRSRYAKLLGVHKSALIPHIAMFERFEHQWGEAERSRPAESNQRLSEEQPIGASELRSTPGQALKPVIRPDFEGIAAAIADAADIIRRCPSLAVHQIYKIGSTKAQLVLALNECLRRERVPRSKTDRAQISRAHFAERLGVTPAMMTQLRDILIDYEAVLEFIEPLCSAPEMSRFSARTEASYSIDDAARQVVSIYPGLSKHQHYPPEGTAKKIVQVLNSQILGEGLQKSRGGKINRQELMRQIGFSKGLASNYLTIIEDYEDATGGKVPAVEAKIPAIRVWLENQLRDGSLEIRDRKVSRLQLSEQFQLPRNGTVFIRYPRLADLVEEFDNKVRSSGYEPRQTGAKLEELKAILADDPPLTKGGDGIDRTMLAKLVDMTLGILRRPPFLEVIEAADSKLQKARKDDPLISFAGGRTFRFGLLVEQGWPRSYAIRASRCFERIYRSKKKEEAKTHFAALVELHAFIASNGSPACQALREGIAQLLPAKGLEGEFTKASQEYRDHLASVYESIGSRNSKISYTNTVIRHLAADSVLPPSALPLISYRHDNKIHRRTVVEATENSNPGRQRPLVDEYLEFATSMLKQAADVRQIEIDPGDQSDFTKILRKELKGGQFTAADNPASLILSVLDQLIDLIKTAAWAKVQTGRRDWEYGQSLLESGHDPGADFDRLFEKGSINNHERKALLRVYFPRDEEGLANLLKVVADRYDFIYPGIKLNGRPEGQFFQKRALEYGGATRLQAFLTPSQEVVASALTLYLLESGSNVEVGRTLYFDCVETTEEPHHSKVTGYKARAAGKPIFAVLEDRSEAIRAMKWLEEALERIPNLPSDTKKQLFISRRGAELKSLEEYTYRAEFKRLIGSIPELASLGLTPSMLRPTILLKAALESDGRTRLSMAIGQHGRDVHEGYINKYPMRFLRDTEIRHFQHALETVVIGRLEEVHTALGVDAESMGRRIEAVMRTGLGTLCRDRNGRRGNEGTPCTSVDCWNDCPQLIVIAKREEVAVLQIWQHSLRLAEGDWIRDQPDRWEKVWLPWLCFVDAVEVKMRQSFAPVWQEATILAEKIISNRDFRPMRLF
jgi:hypothetical protein